MSKNTWHTEYDLDIMELADPSTPLETVRYWYPILKAEGEANGRTGLLNTHRLAKAEARLTKV